MIRFAENLSHIANLEIPFAKADAIISMFSIDIPPTENDTLFVKGRADLPVEHPLHVEAVRAFGYDSNFILRST